MTNKFDKNYIFKTNNGYEEALEIGLQESLKLIENDKKNTTK